MSKVTDFFLYDGPDSNGWPLEGHLSLTDAAFDATHDMIQWLFPLHEVSNFNVDAPVLNSDDIQLLQSNPHAREQMWRCLERFCRFLGLQLTNEGEIVPATNYDERRKVWCTQYNHNNLRITRAIRSLRLFGLEKEATNLKAAVAEASKGVSSPLANQYWELALHGELLGSLR